MDLRFDNVHKDLHELNEALPVFCSFNKIFIFYPSLFWKAAATHPGVMQLFCPLFSPNNEGGCYREWQSERTEQFLYKNLFMNSFSVSIKFEYWYRNSN